MDLYLAPVNAIIDALINKQLSLRNGIRAGTSALVGEHEGVINAFAKGCEKLYSAAKTKALALLLQRNPPCKSPEQYMTTPDGAISRGLGIMRANTTAQKAFSLKLSQLAIEASIKWLQ